MKPFDIRRDAPLVSVCVITYNHAPYIEQCIESILAQQTDFPFEICIGEDDSSDGTREICQRYADQYPEKIRLFQQDRKDAIHLHGGATGKNNTLKTLKKSRGDYLAICEGDDFWIHPKKLQKQVRVLQEHPEASLCFCNVRVDYEDGTPPHSAHLTPFERRRVRKNKVGLLRKPRRALTVTDLAKRNQFHTPGILIKNWLLTEPIPDYFRSAGLGDWALSMNTARFGCLIFLDEVLAVYRVHPKGFWSEATGLKIPRMVIGTACAMLTSGLFPKEANRILRIKIMSQLRRVWKKSLQDHSPEQISTLLSQLATDAPDLLPDAIRAIGRYDWLHFLRKLILIRRNS